MTNNWLALMIGNSRLHWGYFCGNILQKNWDTQHIKKIEEVQSILSINIPSISSKPIPLYLASVVPSQSKLFQKLPQTIVINKEDIPLKNTYSTIGIDRILAVWGAGYLYEFPCLVIDGGTALTFTGANQKAELVGGAILPGINLQFKSLALNTANLPKIDIDSNLPFRWARNTPDAIKSGVLYTLISGIADFIQDWHLMFPQSKIILTGGDSLVIKKYLDNNLELANKQIVVDTNLIFRGIQSINIKKKKKPWVV